MRVLHVITGLRVGGAEVQLLEVARRTRHEVEVVALYDVGVVGEDQRAVDVRKGLVAQLHALQLQVVVAARRRLAPRRPRLRHDQRHRVLRVRQRQLLAPMHWHHDGLPRVSCLIRPWHRKL